MRTEPTFERIRLQRHRLVFYVNLGKKIKAARRAAGMSQEELGRAVGYTRAWVASVERGAIKIDVLNLLRLGEQLELI